MVSKPRRRSRKNSRKATLKATPFSDRPFRATSNYTMSRNNVQLIQKQLAQAKARREERLASGAYEEVEAGGGESLYFDIKSPQLYQSFPRKESTYTKHKSRSLTDSLDSYQHGVKKEWTILRWNNRPPTMEIRLNLLKFFLPEKIKELRTKMHRTLQRKNFQGVENIELTTRHAKSNNRVHFHILTDDSRSEEELKELFISACERCGLALDEDFQIKARRLWNGKKYFAYFTKYGKKWKDRVILFKRKTGLQKFCQIGKWFKKTKKQIWKEVRAFMKARADAKKNATGEGGNEQEPCFGL